MTLFFDYDLPEELIAQSPVEPRDASRLLVVRRDTQEILHHTFRDLPELLSPGDLLVLNDTRVLPARLVGRRVKTGGRWEGLFLRLTGEGAWEMLAQTRGYPQPGEVFSTVNGLSLRLEGRTGNRHWLMRPHLSDPHPVLLAKYGEVPLPPYIRKGQAEDQDRDRYQTVFAHRLGSVAAPTAGLHFTPELLAALNQRGIRTAKVTLHVGLGTFQPIKTSDPNLHRIHSEWCEIDEEAVAAIQETKARKGRVTAVGTTSTRTLESAAQSGSLAPFRGETSIYIRPPYEFQVLDGLITNFHLPRTTLLLLVQAFTGSDLLRSAYHHAVMEHYRFYSYGDAMLIL